MSVLNDVLKNIDEKKAQQRTLLLSQTLVSPSSLPSYLTWVLGIMAVAIVVLSIQVFFLRADSLSVPPDLYEYPVANSEKPLAVESRDSSGNVNIDIHATAAISQNTIKEESKQPIAKPTLNNIVRKTDATKAEENGIAALKAGKTDQVKRILSSAQPRMRENLNLRVMLKEEPEKVVSYLQANNPDFTSNNELLALAAQAQQRAGEHRMAVVYYQQLIKRQPQEARWLAGLAISLDGLGENAKARNIYHSVLQTGALPPPLKRFVQYRLKQIGTNNEK